MTDEELRAAWLAGELKVRNCDQDKLDYDETGQIDVETPRNTPIHPHIADYDLNCRACALFGPPCSDWCAKHYWDVGG